MTGPTRRGDRGTRAPLGTATWLGIVLLGAFVVLATVGRLVAGSPTALVDRGLLPPSIQHPFGTDNLGRDLFARAATGAWTSLVIASCSVLLGLTAAVPIGLAAAWRQGRMLDHALMRVVELAQVVPAFVLVVVLLGLSGSGDAEIAGLTVSMSQRLVVCLAICFVPFFARITRSAALAELEEPYVAGLRVLGVPEREIVVREVLPNLAPALGVQVFLAFAVAVFAEGGLSFVGLGVPPPTPTLGNLIAEAGGQLLDGAWWYALIPGLVLVVGITGANLVGDAASDRMQGAKRAGAASYTSPAEPPSLEPSSPRPTEALR